MLMLKNNNNNNENNRYNNDKNETNSHNSNSDNNDNNNSNSNSNSNKLITDIVSDSSQANLLQEEMLRAIEEEIAAQRQVKEGEAVLENLKKIKDDATINSDDL
eukprot:Awhi_evm1s11100